MQIKQLNLLILFVMIQSSCILMKRTIKVEVKTDEEITKYVLDNELQFDFVIRPSDNSTINRIPEYCMNGVQFVNIYDSIGNLLKISEGVNCEIDAMNFLKFMREKMKVVGIDEKLINRPVNQGFSGGEKKRNEIFQLQMLQPKLAVLDETDSGLDIDALKIVSNGVNLFRNKDNAVIVVTHYQRLLDYIVPDFVHVLVNGRIVKSGGKELALELEEKGYDWVINPETETASV